MKTIIIGLALTAGLLLFGCGETKETSGTKPAPETNTTPPGNNTNSSQTQTQSAPTEDASHDNLTENEKNGEQPGMDNTKGNPDKPNLKVQDSKLRSASFTAATMHCTGCEQTITGNLKKLDGVQDVKASFDTKQVAVTYMGDKVTKEEIARAIEESGFECKINE